MRKGARLEVNACLKPRTIKVIQLTCQCACCIHVRGHCEIHYFGTILDAPAWVSQDFCVDVVLIFAQDVFERFIHVKKVYRMLKDWSASETNHPNDQPLCFMLVSDRTYPSMMPTHADP